MSESGCYSSNFFYKEARTKKIRNQYQQYKKIPYFLRKYKKVQKLFPSDE